MSRHRIRVERGLYRDGSTFYACATPAGSRTARWKSLGDVGVMQARRLRDGSSPMSARAERLRACAIDSERASRPSRPTG
jgi:hypothetical protein